MKTASAFLVRDAPTYPEAFARYEAIRPVPNGERSGLDTCRRTG